MNYKFLCLLTLFLLKLSGVFGEMKTEKSKRAVTCDEITSNIKEKYSIDIKCKFDVKKSNGIDIEITGKNITEIPEIIFSATSDVYSLNLNNNQISEIPKEIGNLSNLNHLYLNNNKISEIPKEIGNLTQLRYLYLESNQISEIPKEIENLNELKYLYLQNNKISELPKEIASLKELKYIYLQNNKIASLSEDVLKIKYMDLTCNCLGDEEVKQVTSICNTADIYCTLKNNSKENCSEGGTVIDSCIVKENDNSGERRVKILGSLLFTFVSSVIVALL